MIYVVSPYWHSDPAVRNQRFRAACRATAQMIRDGITVFSPVVYGHALVGEGLPGDWAYWEGHDIEYLMRCDEVVVLQIEGWKESEGVREELRLAEALGKPISYADGAGGYDPTTLVERAGGPHDPHDPDSNPKHIQDRVGRVPLQDGAPRQHHGVDRVENPDKQKGTRRAQPADKRKAENSHQDANHLNDSHVPGNEAVDGTHRKNCSPRWVNGPHEYTGSHDEATHAPSA